MLNQHTPTPENQQEEWRPVVGYEGLYEVSDLGRVRRIRTREGNLRAVPRVLRTELVQRYARLDLSKMIDGKAVARHHFVHKLVAAAFIGPRPSGMEVNHKDLNPGNNRRDNLEYVTSSGNRVHAVQHGCGVGENHGSAKVTAAVVREIRQSTEQTKVLADRFGLSTGRVRALRRGEGWPEVGE